MKSDPNNLLAAGFRPATCDGRQQHPRKQTGYDIFLLIYIF